MVVVWPKPPASDVRWFHNIISTTALNVAATDLWGLSFDLTFVDKVLVGGKWTPVLRYTTTAQFFDITYSYPGGLFVVCPDFTQMGTQYYSGGWSYETACELNIRMFFNTAAVQAVTTSDSFRLEVTSTEGGTGKRMAHTVVFTEM